MYGCCWWNSIVGGMVTPKGYSYHMNTQQPNLLGRDIIQFSHQNRGGRTTQRLVTEEINV